MMSSPRGKGTVNTSIPVKMGKESEILFKESFVWA